MKRINFLVGATLEVGVVLGLQATRMLSAQDNSKGDTVLKRKELKGLCSNTDSAFIINDLRCMAVNKTLSHENRRDSY